MTVETNYLELYCAIQEIAQFKEQFPTVAKIAKVDAFAKRNKLQLEIMYDKIGKLYEKYVERTDDGKDYKLQQRVVDDNGTPTQIVEPVYKEGMGGKFKEEYDKLMGSYCKIEY